MNHCDDVEKVGRVAVEIERIRESKGRIRRDRLRKGWTQSSVMDDGLSTFGSRFVIDLRRVSPGREGILTALNR